MTNNKQKLADYDSKIVKDEAEKLTKGLLSTREKLEKIFLYVRDDIRFGFPAKGDFVKASETIKSGVGQCNTKTTLFIALCKSVGIPARIHFSLIKKDIQKGIFPVWAYALLPPLLSHCWLEIDVDSE